MKSSATAMIDMTPRRSTGALVLNTSTDPDRYVIRYTDGSQGPDCKTSFCAVLSVNPLDGRSVDALLVNGRAYTLDKPLSATAFFVKYSQAARDALDTHDALAVLP